MRKKEVSDDVKDLINKLADNYEGVFNYFGKIPLSSEDIVLQAALETFDGTIPGLVYKLCEWIVELELEASEAEMEYEFAVEMCKKKQSTIQEALNALSGVPKNAK